MGILGIEDYLCYKSIKIKNDEIYIVDSAIRIIFITPQTLYSKTMGRHGVVVIDCEGVDPLVNGEMPTTADIQQLKTKAREIQFYANK